MEADERHDRAAALADELRASVGRFVRATKARADSLPPSRTETLGRLHRDGPQTMAELAQARGVSHQTVSRMVAELEQTGLVTRRPHPSDARGFLIDLSPDGRRALEAELRARAGRIGAAIDACLTPRERQVLERVPDLLDRLARTLAAEDS